MTNTARQPAGQPTGGEFAKKTYAGANVALEEPDTGFDPNGLTGEDKGIWDIIKDAEDYDRDFPSLYSSYSNEHFHDVARTMANHPRYEGLDLRDLEGTGGDMMVLTATNPHNPGTHLSKTVDVRSIVNHDEETDGSAAALAFAKNLGREYDDLKRASRPTTTQDIMNQARVLEMMGREAKVEYTADGGETQRSGTVRAGLFDEEGLPISTASPHGAYVRVTTDEGTEEYHRFTDVADWVSEGAIAER